MSEKVLGVIRVCTMSIFEKLFLMPDRVIVARDREMEREIKTRAREKKRPPPWSASPGGLAAELILSAYGQKKERKG